MGQVLDRSRKFGTIYGVDENGGVYTQDGKVFRGDGTLCGSKIVAQPAQEVAPESAPVDEEKEALKARVAELEAAAASGAAAPDPNTTGAPPVDESKPVTESAEDQLSKLHPAQLKKMIEEKGGTAASGAGSQKENVKILLAMLESESAE